MLAVLLAVHAHAFTLRTTRDGDPIRWDGFPVGYARVAQELDPDGADAAVDAAFEAWAGSGTEIAFEREPAPDGPPERRALDERNHVWIVADWPFGDDVLATTDSWTTPDGELVAFDILLNGELPWATDGDPRAFDLQAAVTHEVGHALGLDHSEVEEATMFAEQLPGDAFRRELTDDDLAAVRALYAEAPLSCSSAPGAPPALLAGLVVLSLVRRRR